MALAVLGLAPAAHATGFTVSFPASAKAVDGRVILLITTNAKGEPRDQINGESVLGIEKTAPPGADLTSWRY